MTIKTNQSAGFTAATLEAANYAELHAFSEGTEEYFDVVTDEDHIGSSNGWYFDEDACREAAEFFTKLADELNRRYNS